MASILDWAVTRIRQATFPLLTAIGTIWMIHCGGGGTPQPTIPPSITTQPQDQTAYSGHVVTFKVAVSGTEPIDCQWQKDGKILPGATGLEFSIASVSLKEDGSRFEAVVSNRAGKLVSHAALLSVVPVQPQIIAGPRSWVVRPGQAAEFTAQVTGYPPISFQWRKNGTPIFGATGSVLAIPYALAADEGEYDVVVSNASGSAVSPSGLLALVRNSSGFSRVAAGETHALAVQGNGNVWIWGFIGWNTLDSSIPTLKYKVPTLVEGIDDVVSVSAGCYTCAVLRRDGTVWTWGLGGYTGHGDLLHRSKPEQVKGLSNIVAISTAGNFTHSLALRNDGLVDGWGRISLNGQNFFLVLHGSAG